MRLTRRDFCLLGTAAGAAVLAGCGGGAGDAGSAGGTSSGGFSPRLDGDVSATLSVVSDYENFESLDEAALGFQSYYPGVTISHEHMDDFANTVAQRISSDPSVALVYLSAFHLDARYGLADQLVDLTQEDIDISAVDPKAYESCYLDGRLPYVPIWYRDLGLVANTDLLSREGLTIPQTYDDFVACCETLISKGYLPVQGHLGNLQYLFTPYAMNYLENSCTTEQFADIRDGKDGAGSALDTPFQFAFDQMAQGYFSYESAQTYEDFYNGAILKFFEGDVPFLAASTSTVSGMAKRESKSEAFQANPFSYEFCYAPFGADHPYVYRDTEGGFGISANCGEPDIAREFYRYCYTKDILNQFSELKGIPSTALEASNKLYDNLPSTDSLPDEYKAFAWDFDDPTRVVEYAFCDTIAPMISGEVTDLAGAEAKVIENARARVAEAGGSSS